LYTWIYHGKINLTYYIGVAWVFFLVRQLMLGRPGIFLRKWALETHFGLYYMSEHILQELKIKP
jgi:hypothetical protein